MKRPISIVAISIIFAVIGVFLLVVSIRAGELFDAALSAVPLLAISVGLLALHPVARRFALWLSRVELLAAAVIAFCAILLPSSATLRLGHTVRTAADSPFLIGLSLVVLSAFFCSVHYVLTRDSIAQLFDR